MINFIDFVRSNKLGLGIERNSGAKRVFDFLKKEENIIICEVFSDVNLPVLSGIASKLEDLFEDDLEFPLRVDRNRQIVGRMVRHIMGFYGYSPVETNMFDRRLRQFSNARCFKTAKVYNKITDKPKLKITPITEVC